MEPTGGSLEAFLDAVSPKVRQRDARSMVELMRTITGEEPLLWGSIVGFGQYHYRYESGREGDAPAAGFAPRRAATTIYPPEGHGVVSSAVAGSSVAASRWETTRVEPSCRMETP